MSAPSTQEVVNAAPCLDEDVQKKRVAAILERLDKLATQFEKDRHFNVGYPESADFSLEPLMRFLNYSINNCGDWAEYCNYLLNTFDMEKEVINYFQDLYDISREESWGYVTTGGTEGNHYGMFLAREKFPKSKVFYSKGGHYSIGKICHLLNMEAHIINDKEDGTMDCEDLAKKVVECGERHPIIFASIGTTVKGAIDDVGEIQRVLRECPLKIEKKDMYIHADEALSGMILPFVKEAGLDEGPVPLYKFSDGIDSIAVSGHKMIGSPFPSGVVIAKKENVDHIRKDIPYIAGHDCTICGSRNGHSVLVLWYLLNIRTRAEHVERIKNCVKMADHVIKRFKDAGATAWRNPYSITVVIKAPSDPCWMRNCLATDNGTSHIITTAHHKTPEKLDALVDDILADYAAHNGEK